MDMNTDMIKHAIGDSFFDYKKEKIISNRGLYAISFSEFTPFFEKLADDILKKIRLIEIDTHKFLKWFCKRTNVRFEVINEKNLEENLELYRELVDNGFMPKVVYQETFLTRSMEQIREIEEAPPEERDRMTTQKNYEFAQRIMGDAGAKYKFSNNRIRRRD